jgi:nicotinate-nucleotide pyrophosphorylase (carboxylating)
MTHDSLRSLVTTALAEDIGSGDITSQWLVPELAQADMLLVAREGLVMCGGFVASEVYKQLSSAISCETLEEEGSLVPAATPLVRISGPARQILTGERVCLNIMQRMCGIATLTHVFAEAVKGTQATILDTRKTMPGMRHLDKYAVRTGGGSNHRMALDDMVLIKDNHIAIANRHWGSGIKELIEKARHQLSTLTPEPHSPIPIVVECDTPEQVREAVAAMPDRILLDNMSLKKMREAVSIVAGRVKLEASGGVSLDRVRDIAATGVDYISVGKITHSAPAADISADMHFA